MMRKLRILILGDLSRDDKPQDPQVEEFVRLLAKEVITQGHHILTMCRTSFDGAVAESANEAVTASGGNPADLILSYHPRLEHPFHKFGTVLKSEVEDW